MQNFAATSENSKTEGLSNSEIKEADQQTHEEVKESDNLDTKCEEKTEKGADVVIDIDKKPVSESSDEIENEGTEKVCRICHLNEESMEILQLGCDCKAELGVCHRHCAEAWFNQRGNRSCEICGKTAKNVETRTLAERQSSRIMVIEWNERAVEARRRSYITNSSATHDDCRWRCQQSCCNFLLACFVIAFTLPWFFRINLPLGLAGDRLVDISLASFFVCLICFIDSSLVSLVFGGVLKEQKVLSVHVRFVPDRMRHLC